MRSLLLPLCPNRRFPQGRIRCVEIRFGSGIEGRWVMEDMEEENAEHDDEGLIGFRTTIVGSEGRLRVFGEGGGADAEHPRPAPVSLWREGRAAPQEYEVPGEGDEVVDAVWQSNNSYYDMAHALALRAFGEACTDGRSKRTGYSAQDGVSDLTATLAAILSATAVVDGGVEGPWVEMAAVPPDWHAYDPLPAAFSGGTRL